ncbi:MAG: PEP-CTERM sorting domain-containing protein [Fimbriimonadaceae bacterium]|nr:PEP-CTERM sorting domain-containing protein [Fimbriimonadaceae bacterium]QYK56913.1 MAG: PEP-CTERM sorting domain-containing protein [Fimbriimonadaceae bacterium]
MKGLRAAFAASALVGFTLANAQIVAFNNFGPGDTYNNGNGYTISEGPPINNDFNQGDQFTAAAGGPVDTITIALGYVTGTNGATITLHTDNNSEPGAVIGSWHITNMGNFGNPGIATTINVGGAVNIVAGQNYWLMASSDPNSWLAWNLNSTGDVGLHAFQTNGGPYAISQATRGAFRVNVVPEPATMVALGAGIAAIAARRRRK